MGILRGNGRQDIFFARLDRIRLYLLLQEGVEKFGHRIHVLCCMTNHVHLIIQVAGIPLARKIMKNVSFRYTRYINKGKNRISHLANKTVKSVLCNIANVAIKHNPELKAYYQKRLKEGKSVLSTQNIIRNKLISRIFAVVNRGTPYVDLLKYAS